MISFLPSLVENMTEVAPAPPEVIQLEENVTEKPNDNILFFKSNRLTFDGRKRTILYVCIAALTIMFFGVFAANTAFVRNNYTETELTKVRNRISELERSLSYLHDELDELKVLKRNSKILND